MVSAQLKRATLSLIASRIPEDKIQLLRNTFTKIDVNGDGQLTIEELKKGLEQIPGFNLKLNDIQKAMEMIDTNQNGLIDYTEFIAACLQSYNYLKENHLKAAFQYFDKDGSGTISKDELRQVLANDECMLQDKDIENLLNGVDANDDGEVDYQEFISMMNKI